MEGRWRKEGKRKADVVWDVLKAAGGVG